MRINRRRIYILPTRFGMMLALMLAAMLIAGLNYNSNLGLAFAFLMVSVALVTMHHCNRNLLGVQVDASTEIDAFAGREAGFAFVLKNDSTIDRRDVEVRCLASTGMCHIAAHSSISVQVAVPVAARGVTRLAQFELRTLYPFGWFHAWTYVQGSLTAYVAPAPSGTRALPAIGGSGTSLRSETRGDEDFSGLRAYEPGVPLKHMAWKVLARGGEAAVRSYTGLAAQPEWLEWSALGGLDTEARLSQLCLWVLESEAAQRVYGLRLPGQQIAPGRGYRSSHRVSSRARRLRHGKATMTTQKVSYEDLMAIAACLALALGAHLATLPLWVMATVLVAGTLRLVLARRGLAAPPRAVRLMISAAAIALLFAQFRTFNGLSAGTALLALMAGLKLMETDTRRDIYIITLIIYFLSIAALLDSDSFWLLAYLIGVCWLTTATLLRLTTARPAPPWRGGMRYATRIMAQALPLALALWLLFPRFAGPLWRMPSSGAEAGSGLSDTMSPGDIDQLALSDEVAFRVRFNGAVPPADERYWRGPVMHDFDGRTWRRTYSPPLNGSGLQPKGPAYRYTISLEPHQHNWVFALDWPSAWDLPHGALNGDYTLMQREPVSRPIDVVVTSYTRVQNTEPLNSRQRDRDTRSPQRHNPRTYELAQTMRTAHPQDMDYIRSVLGMFSTEEFYYTLSPPLLGAESVDEFLFGSKRGFCEHYASAFAILMRDAGIPARVVTGYQGGTFNRFADYWILRQSDAHAWDEVWIEGRGWIRVDPTSAIAPQRVERGLTDAGTAEEALAGRWQRRTPWFADARLRLDAIQQLWRERILLYDQDSQHELMEFLKIPEPDGQKLVMVLAGALTLALCWLTWQVRRELDPAPKERVLRAFSRLCDKLSRVGIARLGHEGAEAYALRVAAQRPDLGPVTTTLCWQYSQLRYSRPSTRVKLGQFEAAVRAFRPRR